MRLLFSALAALAFAMPAQADDDPTMCEFTGSWGDIDGRSSTFMLVMQNQKAFDDDDSVFVAFQNDDWSILKGEKLGRIKVSNEDGGWFDNEAIATDHGFIIWSDFKNIENVFGGVPKAMFVTRNGKTVDKLKADGLFTSWMEFRSCRGKKVAVKDELKRKQQLQREIPKDPFSK